MQLMPERQTGQPALDGPPRRRYLGRPSEQDATVLRLESPTKAAVAGTSVVIPALNEESVIGSVVRRVREYLGPNDEVIVVDDGSTDGTAAAAADAGARVISRPYNFGNGSAIKTGARAALGQYVLMLDADGQHDPAEIPELLRRLKTYDMVVAAREMDSHASRGRRLANAVFNRLASNLTGREILDLTSGYRAVRKHVIEEFLPLLPNRFSYPTTITMAALRAGYTVDYLPIRAAKRQGKEKSKIKPVRDGLRFLQIIFKVITLFAPMRVFTPVSAVPAALGVGTIIGGLLLGNGISMLGSMLLMTAMFLFCVGLISEQISALRFERHGNHGLSANELVAAGA